MSDRKSMKDRKQQASESERDFLEWRLQRVEGETVGAAFGRTFAIVRSLGRVLGLVAADGEGGVWYTSQAADQAAIVALGFRYSDHNLLAALYFHLPFASFVRRPAMPAATRPQEPVRHFPTPRPQPARSVAPAVLPRVA